ncbi:putative late blight resistance protein R1-A-like isoform 2 [Capsicum annuum]|nr:putative late blight resistance protein R1-A-like isoform 2 [Capsicum annuum]
MVNAVTRSTSTCNIHVMIEFSLIILTDVPKDVIRHDKLFDLMARVEALTKEVFVLFCNLEESTRNQENMNETSSASLNLLENIEILKKDLRNVFLKGFADSSQLCFPTNMAYAAEHAINSIIVRDNGFLQLIFVLPDTIEKIKLVKKEVQQKISKNTNIIFANSPNKPVKSKPSRTEKKVSGEEHCPDKLLDVGEKIAQKCDGLPLVLDLIGGVISRMEKKEALWLEVLNNLSSFIFKDEEEVIKIIQLSYDHLSDHLKLCLIYLASYPKDKYIAISDLEYLWSAEAPMEQSEVKVYVDELISSSLIVVSNERDAYPCCQIHDLVQDFCLRKARKEKLFDLISPSGLSSSPSDLMPRGMTAHYDQHFPHLDVNFFLLNAKRDNPYVKRLLSLTVYIDDHDGLYLSYKCNLRHLRLLKRLELPDITLPDSLLNKIGMLVHLKCLNILTEAKDLPPSLSNLWNLETLVLDSLERSCMVLSPVIWTLSKLQNVRINCCSLFDHYINKPTMLDED